MTPQIKTSRTYQPHNALQPVPKASQPRELTQAEKAARYDQLLDYQEKINRNEIIMNRAIGHRNLLTSQFNALLNQGLISSGRDGHGPCPACNYDLCECEGIG